MSTLLKGKLDANIRHLNLISERSGITQFERVIGDKSQTVDLLYERLMISYKNKTEILEKQFSAICGKLSVLSPLAVFERGYCSASKDGRMLNSVEDLNTGDIIKLRLTDGEADCTVNERRNINEI